MSYNSTKRWYLYMIVLFTFDIVLSALFEQQIICSLLCFYACSLFSSISTRHLSILIFLILSEQFLIFGNFGLPLLYLLPITIFVLKARQLFYIHTIAPYLILLACLCAQLLIIEPYMFHISCPLCYTLSKFLGNIIAMMLLSLKFSPR